MRRVEDGLVLRSLRRIFLEGFDPWMARSSETMIDVLVYQNIS